MNKKISVLFMVATIGFSASAQKKISVNGAHKDAKTAYLVTFTSNSETIRDSVEVKNGNFSFTVTDKEPFFAMVGTTSDALTPIIVDGDVKVDLEKKTVKGSQLNHSFHVWQQRMHVFQERLDSMNAVAKSYKARNEKIPAEIIEKLNELYVNNLKTQAQRLKDCCNENKDNILPAYFLRNNYRVLGEEDLLTLGDASNVYMKDPLTQRMKKEIESVKKKMIGARYTDFEMADTTGVNHKLSEYMGKSYVLVDFWASWCGPCRAEMPYVRAAYEKYAPKGFQIVGISFDTKADAWKQAIRSLKLPWNHLSDLKGWKSLGAEIYGIHSIPSTLLFDKDGKIVAKNLRGNELAEKLAELYK